MRAILAVLVLSGCGGCGGPLVAPGGRWLVGTCVKDETACNHSSGEVYACVGGVWAHLTKCPAQGCPYDAPDGGFVPCTKDE
jgi:hypothetical protein